LYTRCAKEIGDSIIDDINEVFDTDAKFHSVFVHHKDEVNVVLETSGVVSGRGTISAVYTMPKENTESMYSKLSTILIPGSIRELGGFYDVAKKLSLENSATMTISIIPNENSSLYQIKLSANYPDSASDIKKIDPLEFLKIDELKRSDYFADGFYPLNSLLQVVILSNELTNVSEINTNIIPTEIINGTKIPTELSLNGWIFEPESGDKIEGKYLFGTKTSVDKNELVFTLGSKTDGEISVQTSDFDESILIVIIIVIVAGVATAFYLKGYRKSD